MSNSGPVVVEVEEGFSSRDIGTEGISDFSIKPGRRFPQKSLTKGAADHMQIAFIPASLSGTSRAESSPDPIVRAAIDHHHINVGIGNPPAVAGPKPSFPVKRSRSGRGSLPWILRPRRLLFLFATLSSMGTMILIYLTLLISKGNNPTV